MVHISYNICSEISLPKNMMKTNRITQGTQLPNILNNLLNTSWNRNLLKHTVNDKLGIPFNNDLTPPAIKGKSKTIP
ncbi:hypothetical protein GBA52_003758 [Prunus armeniaca]|nr:hypothetical protein GBA52_003758 [Prunus armeniaca]